jgi:hypothetical protein
MAAGGLSKEQIETYKTRKKYLNEELDALDKIDKAWHNVDIDAIHSANTLQEFNDAID